MHRATTGWAEVLEANGTTPAKVRRLVRQLRACEVAALAFCRLLERWGRGDPVPATPGARRGRSVTPPTAWRPRSPASRRRSPPT